MPEYFIPINEEERNMLKAFLRSEFDKPYEFAHAGYQEKMINIADKWAFKDLAEEMRKDLQIKNTNP